ncbi:uncharacterized protein [Periplaneta americana]|uniref:uncharacterized protein n=1 Tax=Periplaneta americana TaxID=6978 RepID=UPI0037E7AEF7
MKILCRSRIRSPSGRRGALLRIPECGQPERGEQATRRRGADETEAQRGPEQRVRALQRLALLIEMTSRSVLGRPRRTKVYDCNFTAGERYYRPVVDSLDRRTPGGFSSPDSASFPSLRATLSAEEPPRPRRPTPRLDDDFEVEEPRRKAKTALMDEYDSIFENRGRALRGERATRGERERTLRDLEDEADQEISSYLRRVRETRPARPTLEDEFESEVTPRGSKRRPMIDFQEKLLDTVGLKNSDIDKARSAIEDDAFFKRRTLKVTDEEDEGAPSLTKWTSLARRGQLNGDEGSDTGAAAARARKTRSRLADLNAEIEELAGRTAAREKRVAQLRALVQENEANAAVEARVVQKTSVRTEKKSVTF